MNHEKQKKLTELGYEWFKGSSTDWCFADYFKIPKEKRFRCEWTYSVDSPANNFLYSYNETRSVSQLAVVAKVTFDTRNGEKKLFDIEIQDPLGVRILKKNCDKELYNRIINDIKTACEED